MRLDEDSKELKSSCGSLLSFLIFLTLSYHACQKLTKFEEFYMLPTITDYFRDSDFVFTAEIGFNVAVGF